METTLSEDECRSALRRALRRTDFVLDRLQEKPANEQSSGFMARHLSLVASVSVNGESKDVHLFVKVPPPSDAHRKLLEEMQHFEKELVMYESVVPVMSEALPDGVHLPLARCFLIRRADPEGVGKETIVMEDLREEGYRMWDKMVPFDWAHCLSVVKCLARFHAAPFLVQRAVVLAGGKGDNRDYVDGTFRVAKDWILADTSGEMGRLWFESSVDTFATSASGLWPERFGGDGERKLASHLREAWGEVSEMVRPSGKYTNVVCHGDLWANNLMFRYEGGEPAEAKLVDLQLVRFSPPVVDILMFFHTSTTKAFREKHMMDLVLAYHRHLEEIVGKALLDELMPLRTLLDCMEEFALFGKLISVLWCSIILLSEGEDPVEGAAGDPPDFVSTIMRNRGKSVLSNARKSEVFRTRVTESYEEFLRHLGLWV